MTPQDQARLDALATLARTGGRAEAELALHEWCRHDGPPAARTLLAALLIRRGDLAGAKAVPGNLARQAGANLDADETKLAISVLLMAGENDAARRLGARLMQLHSHRPEVVQWLQTLELPGLPRQSAAPTLADEEVSQTAAELSVRLGIVPSLVYALKLSPRTRPISLLRASLTELVAQAGDAHSPEMPYLLQGLADLSMLLGDDAAARQWAHRTLRLDPYNASMALLLGQLDDDESVGPTAQETLRRVSLKFPGYPDVQKAYARRVELDRTSAHNPQQRVA